MTRLVTLGLLLAGMVALPLSHLAISAPGGKGKPGKVSLCHFPSDKEEGRVIEVSEAAVAVHVSKHEDCTSYVVLDENGKICRCATCREKCQADYEKCRADCSPRDRRCLHNCALANRRCIVNCARGSKCKIICEKSYQRCLASGRNPRQCERERAQCLANCD